MYKFTLFGLVSTLNLGRNNIAREKARSFVFSLRLHIPYELTIFSMCVGRIIALYYSRNVSISSLLSSFVELFFDRISSVSLLVSVGLFILRGDAGIICVKSIKGVENNKENGSIIFYCNFINTGQALISPTKIMYSLLTIYKNYFKKS